MALLPGTYEFYIEMKWLTKTVNILKYKFEMFIKFKDNFDYYSVILNHVFACPFLRFYNFYFSTIYACIKCTKV